jgi:hypothetical protein
MAQDEFADIAERGREINSDAVERIPPREYERDPLDNYEGDVPSAAPASHAERLDAFDDDLAALREEHARFLRELQPDLTVERPTRKLESFDFRYEADADGGEFDRVLDGAGEWEAVTVPEFRGPEGRWTGFYRTTFEYDAPERDRVYLRFEGADYIARVYLNGRCLGDHEGIFAPFEFDVTDELRSGQNVLVVEIENDYSIIGPNSIESDLDGDKIYACNGPGWDDPDGGWQNCPAGAGITHAVRLEERFDVHVDDLFARPRLDDDTVEAWIDVENATVDRRDVELDLSIVPQNFEGEPLHDARHEVPEAGISRNDYRVPIGLDHYRVWSPDEPWLYALQVDVRVDGEVVDSAETQFGMRSFELDDSTEPKGEPRLNGDPIRLRGANTMGHLQRCVIDGDRDQLVDDVLIAKLANQNYFRLTQRPVHDEVYEVCDKLGVMLQTDLPLFGNLRPTQFTEAIRQSEELERLIRTHPSAVLVSFMNEAFTVERGDDAHRPAHRFCSRPAVEDFFDAATGAIRHANPDREIKRVEGDYDPPTRTGLSDFHCYTLWYTNHALPIGELHAGWLPEIDPEWLTACGEYGAEGLDNLDLMLDRYPDEWLPESLDEPWTPADIRMSQTFGMHGDWFDEQDTIESWIETSQRHQARSATLLTDAFRRRADRVTMSAIHLLIDAWPDGWQKAIVDTHRTPKRAYFAYQDANEPVRVHLRTDKHAYYADESVDVEAWLLNDEPEQLTGHRIEVALRVDGDQIGAVSRDDLTLDPVSSDYEGHVDLTLPWVAERTPAALDAVLYDRDDEIVNRERLELEVFPEPGSVDSRVAAVGESATDLLDSLDIDSVQRTADPVPDTIVVGGDASLDDELADAVAGGATVLLLRRGDDSEPWELDVAQIDTSAHHGLTFVAPTDDLPETDAVNSDDLAFPYDATADRIGFVADSYLTSDALEPVVHTFPDKAAVGGMAAYDKKRKDRAPVVGKMAHGDGTVYVSELLTKGRAGENPALDQFLRSLIDAT